MGPEDVIPIVQQYVNIKGVALAVVLTQIVKYWMPSPQPFRTTEVISGSIYSRVLPFLPVLFGILYCTLIESTATVMEDVIRGVFTGASGAYAYRTAKVTVFGG